MIDDVLFREWATLATQVLEGLGIVAIAVGILISGFRASRNLFRREGDVFQRLRRDLGRSILLGLEFLIAGDIVRTVAIDPTLENVGILAIIVLVRTGLSFALELEISGRWPWQSKRGDEDAFGADRRGAPSSSS